VSRVCRVQGLSCPGFVVSRVCRVQGLSVQGLSCPGFVGVSDKVVHSKAAAIPTMLKACTIIHSLQGSQISVKGY
jgi:hypothetical protein